MTAPEPPPSALGASARPGRATGAQGGGPTQVPLAPPRLGPNAAEASGDRALDLEAGQGADEHLAVSSHSGHSHDGDHHGHGHEHGHGDGHGHGHDDHGCGHRHYSNRAPWLRAALLGAQDGLISVSSLMIGVGAIKEDRNSMVISGLAGLVAGACSMAIGEYVSVYGQRDIEEADINTERAEFAKGPAAVARELEELTQIYVERGLQYPLAKQVATELSAVDPIRAHARDELGIDMDDMSNPVQAALASAVCFVTGAIVPLLSAAFILTYWIRILVVLIVSTIMFIAFGALGAYMGGARLGKAALRTTLGGLLAIGITYGILRAFGTTYA